jgi:type II secretory pathway pseudopilin PulG
MALPDLLPQSYPRCQKPVLSYKPSVMAFTLVEVSVVLIIIGLLLGGIVAGNALIEAATNRKAVAQIEELNNAVNAFMTKYRCLPGDCPDAASYGFTQFSPSGATITAGGAYDGDGNGMIHNTAPFGTAVLPTQVGVHEVQQAMWSMQEARLINGVTVFHSSTLNEATAYLPAAFSGNFQGSAAMWSLTYYDAEDLDQTNPLFLSEMGHYYLLSGNLKDSGIYTVLNASRAFAFDSKMDDGLPLSGMVRAATSNDSTAPSWFIPADFEGGAPGADSPYCLTNETPARYNVRNESGFDPSYVNLHSGCTLVVRAPF